jgi:hypothetical protein
MGTACGVKVPLGAMLVYPEGIIAKRQNQRVHEIATGLIL